MFYVRQILGALNPIAFELGPFSIRWYAIIIVIAIILGDFLIRREGQRKGYDEDTLFDLIFPALLFGGIGARLYYVLFRLDYYLANPSEIIAIWHGGMAIYGFVIGAGLTLIYLCRKKNINVVENFDIIAPTLLLGQAIGRWANFMNQEAHGGPVSRLFLEKLHLPGWLIEQMNIQGTYYHPTFLYESIWSFVGFFLLIYIRRKKQFALEGEIIAGYAIWYGLGRVWIEGMRTDSLYLGPLRISQWVSALFIIVGLVFIVYRRLHSTNIPYYTDNRYEE
ncbi:prolipoprotein diacylglyceryl transferase [Aerococcaceae bacterium DSM 111020]|nr:prolipoprotein diacylglyceryl transferase [Aerococcaceae bacterium DSM 111020]